MIERACFFHDRYTDAGDQSGVTGAYADLMTYMLSIRYGIFDMRCAINRWHAETKDGVNYGEYKLDVEKVNDDGIPSAYYDLYDCEDEVEIIMSSKFVFDDGDWTDTPIMKRYLDHGLLRACVVEVPAGVLSGISGVEDQIRGALQWAFAIEIGAKKKRGALVRMKIKPNNVLHWKLANKV